LLQLFQVEVVNAVPRVRTKGVFILPLAGTLDRIVTTYLPGVVVPPYPAGQLVPEQGDLFEVE